MDDKKKFESPEEEPLELNDEELENIAGGIEVPPPLAPPAPIGEGRLGEEQKTVPCSQLEILDS